MARHFYQVGRCKMNGAIGRPRDACLFHEPENGKLAPCERMALANQTAAHFYAGVCADCGQRRPHWRVEEVTA